MTTQTVVEDRIEDAVQRAGRRRCLVPDLLAGGEGPMYQRLYRQLRDLITDGVWQEGERIPSSRLLSERLGLSRNTTAVALEQLVADGFAFARPGAGVFASLPVDEDRFEARRASADAREEGPRLFRIAPDILDATTLSMWRDVQRRVWQAIAADGYPVTGTAGHTGLRHAIALMLRTRRDIRCSPDEVIVASSAPSALDRCARALLRPGDAVLVENPGDPAMSRMLLDRGLVVVPVEIDDEGFDIDSALELAPEARAACVMPVAQFPTGAEMSRPRRARLATWARESGAWIIERDADAGPGSDGTVGALPIAAEFPRDRTIHLFSFNEALMPELGIAFALVPAAVAGSVSASVGSGECVNLANQMALAEFLECGQLGLHLRRRHVHHGRMRALLDQCVQPYLGSAFTSSPNPSAGHLVLRPAKACCRKLRAAMAVEGLDATPFDDLSHSHPIDGIALNFAGHAEAAIVDAMPRFRSALAHAANRSPQNGNPVSGHNTPRTFRDAVPAAPVGPPVLPCG